MTGVLATIAGSGAKPKAQISPGDQSLSGSTATQDFTETASLSYGTPSAYSWSVTGVGWSIVSGATSATVTIRSASVSSGNSTSASATCTMTYLGNSYPISANLDYTRF